MLKFTAIVAIAALAHTASAHLCVISPIQRGGFLTANISTAGSDACFQTSPCQTTPQGAPSGFFQLGESSYVTFQKNLDHWNATNPGYFGVYLSSAAKPGPVLIDEILDDGRPSLSFYTAILDLPLSQWAPGSAVLQVRYVTDSSSAPAVFYQCVDVSLLAPPFADAKGSEAVHHLHH